MKITKTKEVVSEEFEIFPGTYYFEDEDLVSYKMELQKEDENGFSDYRLEIIKNFSNIYGITIKMSG